MVVRGEVFKCEVCGNIVEVVHEGKGQLVCCGQPMRLMAASYAAPETEKHVPYIQRVDGGYLVRLGKNELHPMEEDHYIEWIEMYAGGSYFRRYLLPGMDPEVFFSAEEDEAVRARAYCNIHGLWTSKSKEGG